MRLFGFAKNGATVRVCVCTGTTVNFITYLLHFLALISIMLASNDTVPIWMWRGEVMCSTNLRISLFLAHRLISFVFSRQHQSLYIPSPNFYFISLLRKFINLHLGTVFRISMLFGFRSTPPSRPNNIRGGKCPSVGTRYVRPSVRPSTKSFFFRFQWNLVCR